MSKASHFLDLVNLDREVERQQRVGNTELSTRKRVSNRHWFVLTLSELVGLDLHVFKQMDFPFDALHVWLMLTSF